MYEKEEREGKILPQGGGSGGGRVGEALHSNLNNVDFQGIYHWPLSY